MSERRFYENVFRPQVIDRLDPEFAHDWSWRALHQIAKIPGAIEAIAGKPVDDKRLQVVLGRRSDETVRIHARNPVWVGAGPTKTGIGLEVLKQAGAGGVIVGAVLEKPQPGNPKRRLWKVEGGKYVNAFGFNSPGMVVVRQNLEQYDGLDIPVVVNVGKNADVDVEDIDAVTKNYTAVVDHLYEVVDGFEICTSSPNTLQLRKLLREDYMRRLAYGVVNTQAKRGLVLPTSIKPSPDMDEEGAYGLIRVANEFGLILSPTNTTTDPTIFNEHFSHFKDIRDEDGNFRGGASGDIPKFRERADKMLAFFYREGGPDLELWGGGGINETIHMWRKVIFGADMGYIVAGVAQKGLGVFNQINRGLSGTLDGLPNKSRLISHYRGRAT